MLEYVGPCGAHGFIGLVRTKDVDTESVVVVQITSEALRDKFGWQGDPGEGAEANLGSIMAAANKRHKSGQPGPLLLTTEDF